MRRVVILLFFKMAEKVCSAGRKYYNLNTNADYLLCNSMSEEVGRAMYLPLQRNQVFSPYDYVNVMNH